MLQQFSGEAVHITAFIRYAPLNESIVNIVFLDTDHSATLLRGMKNSLFENLKFETSIAPFVSYTRRMGVAKPKVCNMEIDCKLDDQFYSGR